MKKTEKQRREAPPVENPHDRRSRERAKGDDPFPRAPKAPDGISGNWK
jgi:hypothetical protein